MGGLSSGTASRLSPIETLAKHVDVEGPQEYSVRGRVYAARENPAAEGSSFR